MKETNILDDVELVNKYFFIIGEEIVKEWMEDLQLLIYLKFDFLIKKTLSLKIS